MNLCSLPAVVQSVSQNVVRLFARQKCSTQTAKYQGGPSVQPVYVPRQNLLTSGNISSSSSHSCGPRIARSRTKTPTDSTICRRWILNMIRWDTATKLVHPIGNLLERQPHERASVVATGEITPGRRGGGVTAEKVCGIARLSRRVRGGRC
jgi:hypothetical protein